METNEEMVDPKRPGRRRTSWVATAAVATGLAIGAAGLAGAATGGSGSAASGSAATADSSSAATAPTAPSGNRPDPSTMSHGPGETLLTGDDATKAEAAALEAVPGATVIRVETDSNGGTYEAHLKKADGSFVTVQFDADFNVTSTDSGFGGGPGGGGPGGQPPAGAPSDASGTSASN